jgi:hypothetical protein
MVLWFIILFDCCKCGICPTDWHFLRAHCSAEGHITVYTLSVLHEVYNLFICELFNNVVSSSDYTASNDMMVNEWWTGKDVEWSSHGLVLFQHLPGGTEENHDNPQSGKPVSKLRFQPDTLKVQNRSINHSATTFTEAYNWWDIRIKEYRWHYLARGRILVLFILLNDSIKWIHYRVFMN